MPNLGSDSSNPKEIFLVSIFTFLLFYLTANKRLMLVCVGHCRRCHKEREINGLLIMWVTKLNPEFGTRSYVPRGRGRRVESIREVFGCRLYWGPRPLCNNNGRGTRGECGTPLQSKNPPGTPPHPGSRSTVPLYMKFAVSYPQLTGLHTNTTIRLIYYLRQYKSWYVLYFSFFFAQNKYDRRCQYIDIQDHTRIKKK